MHMVYIINGEEQINYVDVLKEYIPYIYNFVMDLKSNLRDNHILSLWAVSRNKNVRF
jgi:hypothetical protein